MIVIGISGKKRSGKDTVANYIKELLPEHSTRTVAFADALKEEVAKACGTTVTFIEANKEVFRPILQWWGTDFRRRFSSTTYWIEKFLHRVNVINDANIILVPDVRFLNEAESLHAINALGIRVERPNILTGRAEEKHSSEMDLDGWPKFDYTIHNTSTLENLKQQTLKMLHTLCINQPQHNPLVNSR